MWIAVLLGVLAWTPDAPHGGAFAAEHAAPCGAMHGAEGGAHGDGCAHTGAAECGCAATCCAAALDAAPGAPRDGAAGAAAPRGRIAGGRAAEPPTRPPIRAA